MSATDLRRPIASWPQPSSPIRCPARCPECRSAIVTMANDGMRRPEECDWQCLACGKYFRPEQGSE